MFPIYDFCLIILILHGVYAWPCLNISNHLLMAIYVLTIVIGCIISGCYKLFDSRAKIIWTIVFIVGAIVGARTINGTLFRTILQVLVLLQILSLKGKDLKIIIRGINKFFTIIIAISVCLFIVKNIQIPLPSFGVINYYQYYLVNYLFFLSESSIRFYGFCVEPGYFALLLSCLICLNEYRLSKSNVVYLFAMAFTLSLGGFIITLIGWFVHFVISNNNHTSFLKRLGMFLICVVVLFFLISQSGLFGNYFNEYILDRLAFDADKGFAGNNRVNERFDLLWASFLMSKDVLWGMGTESYFYAIEGLNLDGASYRVFIMQYGFIYTLALLASFIILGKSFNSRLIISAGLVYLLDFLQHGTPFQGVFCILFLVFSLYDKNKLTNKNIISHGS